jgi:hypothetical protein
MRRTPQSRAARATIVAARTVDRREVALDQGVDEEVHDVDAHAGAPHGVLVEQVAAHHLGGAAHGTSRSFAGSRTRQRTASPSSSSRGASRRRRSRWRR